MDSEKAVLEELSRNALESGDEYLFSKVARFDEDLLVRVLPAFDQITIHRSIHFPSEVLLESLAVRLVAFNGARSDSSIFPLFTGLGESRFHFCVLTTGPIQVEPAEPLPEILARFERATDSIGRAQSEEELFSALAKSRIEFGMEDSRFAQVRVSNPPLRSELILREFERRYEMDLGGLRKKSEVTFSLNGRHEVAFRTVSDAVLGISIRSTREMGDGRFGVGILESAGEMAAIGAVPYATARKEFCLDLIAPNCSKDIPTLLSRFEGAVDSLYRILSDQDFQVDTRELNPCGRGEIRV